MVENYKKHIEEVSNKTGFIKSTLEKVERLLNILEWINNHEKLSKLLALKGGTAINTAIYNFPRLSVDIDLDLTENLEKDEMIKERENIHNLLVNYLNANTYKINKEKSKNVYALDSIVAEYVDNKEEIFTDIFSTLLNNFGVVSYEYGVIKKYDVKIKFNFSNYKIK